MKQYELDEAFEILEKERKERALKRAGWRKNGYLWEMPDKDTESPPKSVIPTTPVSSHKYQSNAFTDALGDFIAHRGKKLTKVALQRVINKLEKYCVSEQHAIFTLNQSIERSWSGVFPESALKEMEQVERERANQPILQERKKIEPIPSDFLEWAEEKGYETHSVKQLWSQDSVREEYHADH